jgi:hypothetical protein
MILIAYAVHHKKIPLIRFGAFLVVIGIFLNRLNTAYITFNWQLSYREIPHWREVAICVTVYCIYIAVYRFILYRLPIFYQWRSAEEPCLSAVPVPVSRGAEVINTEPLTSGSYRKSLQPETELN